MRKITRFCSLLIMLCGTFSIAAGAQGRPTPASTLHTRHPGVGHDKKASGHDGRIRTLPYTDGRVVTIAGCPKFQTMVQFSPREKIENVGLGDATQWQVTPNRRADLLFVKPLSGDAFSNMTVVTSHHTYDFELKTKSPGACEGGEVVYDLRFIYPDDPPPPGSTPVTKPKPEDQLPLPEKRNTAYTYDGDKILVPMRAFDDGHATYLMWAKGIPVPAIYAIAPGGGQSLINYVSKGDYIVIQQVAMAFALRRGKLKATLINDSYVVPELDAKSPQPVKKKESSFWPF